MSNHETHHEFEKVIRVIYWFYMLSPLLAGVLSPIGVVMAYVYRGDAEQELWRKHLNSQIHLFWIGLLAISLPWLVLAVLATWLHNPLIWGLVVLWPCAVYAWVLKNCITGLRCLAVEQISY